MPILHFSVYYQMKIDIERSHTYKLINHYSGEDLEHNNRAITDFLYRNLDQFGDEKVFILKALEYVFNPERGGNIILALDRKTIIGAVVLNNTNMSGYIPENILVYIAVHSEYRGRGLGKELMRQAIKISDGSIALHVEPDNPAKFLYEKIGFTNKYLEMRLNR